MTADQKSKSKVIITLVTCSAFLRETFLKATVLSVFALVLVWNIATTSAEIARWLEQPGDVRATLRELRDVNLHLQMRLYQFLFAITHPTDPESENLRLVYIDDNAHWGNLKGELPTNRNYLANLIRNLSKPGTTAAVIGLDIDLLAPRGGNPGSDVEERRSADEQLASEIRSASAHGVPVILAEVYGEVSDREYRLLPNVYADVNTLIPKGEHCGHIPCPAFGYINLPTDKRLVPLTKSVISSVGSPPEQIDSFAQAIAEASEQSYASHRTRLPKNSRPEEDDRTFGSFQTEAQFKSVSSLELAVDNASAERECAKKIVIIGGNWHELQGYGKQVDLHLSPAGDMSGMSLHANYVESLLQRRTAHEIPLWIDILFDLAFGLVVYVCFEVLHGWWQIALLLTAVSCLPLFFAWALFVTMNVYLDFVLPVELYFLHIAYEVGYEVVKSHMGNKAAGHCPTSPTDPDPTPSVV